MTKEYIREHNDLLKCDIYYKPAIESKKKYRIKKLFLHTREPLIYLLTYKLIASAKDKIVEFLYNNYYLDDRTFFTKISMLISDDMKIKTDKRGNYGIRAIERLINLNEIHPTFYLDVGCFEGEITVSVGEYFKLNKFQIHGIDIKKYESYDNFVFTLYDGINIPYSNESFDLITCLMVLHHVSDENLDKLLNELYRVMKPGGRLILRERNASADDCDLLDILHEYFDAVLNKKNTWIETKGFYKTASNWIESMTRAGFKLDKMPILKKYNKRNPFNNFIVSFTKIRPDKELKQFFRTLDDDAPREKYVRYHGRRDFIHWGQRKLLLSEIEFFNIIIEKSGHENHVVVYAGSAPGTHIKFLSQLFPKLYFILYDPREFDKNLSKNKMIEKKQEYFTDDVCYDLVKKYDK